MPSPLRHRLRACVRLLAIAGCVGTAKAAVDCVPQTAVDVTRIAPRIVLVGEAHGTNEIPRFVEGLVCSLLQAGRPVIVGVEHGDEQQAALNRYLVSDGDGNARRDLLQGINWRRYSDGRGSVAMLGLVDALRRLRGQGQPVAVLAIGRNESLDMPLPDAERVPVPPAANALLNRLGNESMANAVLYAATLYPRAVVVVLAGYSHTSTRFAVTNDPMFGSYRPMGQVLVEQMPVFTVGIETGGGVRAGTGRDGSRDYALDAGPLTVDGTTVDATVRLDRVTASPPARDVVR